MYSKEDTICDKDDGTKYLMAYDYSTVETKTISGVKIETYYDEFGVWISEFKTVDGRKTSRYNEKLFNPDVN